jgi:hypothetical protein
MFSGILYSEIIAFLTSLLKHESISETSTSSQDSKTGYFSV